MRNVVVLSSSKERLSSPVAELAIATVLSALAAWLGGFALNYRSEFGLSQYGLPLAWKTQVEHSPIIELVSVTYSTTSYSWDALLVDVLLYIGVFYSLILLWRGRKFVLWRVLMLVSAAWVTVTSLLYSSSSVYGSWSNGLPIPWMGVWLDGLFYNWVRLVMDVALIVALEYLGFFLYRGFRSWTPQSLSPAKLKK